MTISVKNILFAFLAATLLLSAVYVANAATAKEPNLVALPAEDIRLETNGASTTLRFSTVSWNNGDGPVEIEGGLVTGNTQKVTQNIYNDDGSVATHHAGDFVYHDDHNHIHFEGYADYILQPVAAPGASERYGQKTSFCLMDTDRINHKLDGAPKRAQYTTCSSSVQGISVGWGDKYGYQLAGQEIDVTGLPDGDYNLTIEINPKKHLVEQDYTDNVSTVLIRLAGGTVSVVGDDSGDDGNTGPGNGNGGGNGGGRPF